jgi:hypothetical protein
MSVMPRIEAPTDAQLLTIRHMCDPEDVEAHSSPCLEAKVVWLRPVVAERDALRAALTEIAETNSPLGAVTHTENKMRALARRVLAGEAAPPPGETDPGGGTAASSEAKA